jgi:hypothetical protein
VNSASQRGDEEQRAVEQAAKTLMRKLLAAFPQFSPSWEAHLREWEGEPAVPFLGVAAFARFVEDELLVPNKTVEVKRVFAVLDTLFIGSDEPTRDLIGIGFIEDLANITSHREGGNAQVIALLPPVLTRVWRQIEIQWSGRSSLMEVLESEARGRSAERTWAELIDLS